MKMNLSFQFGIEVLDQFLESDDAYPCPKQPLTGCIIGPDGCGKSLLALHLASRYVWNALRDAPECSPPQVIYVSTDFSYDQACRAWGSFGLGNPTLRNRVLTQAHKTLDDASELLRTIAEASTEDKLLEIGLNHISPTASSVLQAECEGEPRPERPDSSDGNSLETLFSAASLANPAASFLDLQRDSAGDDWTFLSHMVGLLPARTTAEPFHLLIVDAVEGLEAFVGERDAFGQRRSRRSRLTELIRSCARASAHVMFIVEEPKRAARLPEQFVTDLVLRLRITSSSDIPVRSLEIEKCRGVPHVLGPHEFFIRSGRGTSTGLPREVDHPAIPWLKETHLAHFYVIASLNAWNTAVRRQIVPVPTAGGRPSFGTTLLALEKQFPSPLRPDTARFVHSGSLTLLVGDSGTKKSRLARAFLADAIVDGNGVAVLIASDLIDRDRISELLKLHAASATLIDADRILCRRLAEQHLSSSQFIHIVATYIRRARALLTTSPHDISGGVNASVCPLDPQRQLQDAQRSSPIRVVIDDWNMMLAAHPNLAEDRFLLPSLISLLKREGVTALIVSTQPGQPTTDAAALLPQDLRKLDEHHLHAWTVPFFGESRTAITLGASVTGRTYPEVFELQAHVLKNGSSCPEALQLSRHFALYAGLDTAHPARAPLHIRLYAGPHSDSDSADSALRFSRVVRPMLQQLFAPRSGEDVVVFEPFDRYDDFFAFADLLDDSRQDHTSVFQIDEFWSDEKQSLLDLTSYWENEVATWTLAGQAGDQGPPCGTICPNTDSDPSKLFQPHLVTSAEVKEAVPNITNRYATRFRATKSQFCRKDMSYCQVDGAPLSNAIGHIDRIPYHWDFGLLLARRDLWQRCADIALGSADGTNADLRVGDIWNMLCIADDNDRLNTTRPTSGGTSHVAVKWWDFLAACRIVGRECGVVPFDVDLHTSETLSCLLLEIWGTIGLDLGRKGFDKLVRRDEEPAVSLRSLLDGNADSLFLAFELLMSGCSHLVSESWRIGRGGVSPGFAASREWYSTASAITRKDVGHQYRILQLPGRLSTRGDWFLAVARGSRSELLGDRALDMLSSRRMNLLRLHDGLGLPVRDILPDDQIGHLQTALTRVIPNTQVVQHLSYAEVCSRGAHNSGVGGGETHSVQWLWRSRLKHYDRDSYYWRLWIARMISERGDWLSPDYLSYERQEHLMDGLGRSECIREEEVIAAMGEKFRVFRPKVDLLRAAFRD